MRVRAKICGITRATDARAAIDAGCDALGFNFYRASPRYVEPARAKDIIAALPPFVASVGLFVNAATEVVRRIADDAGIDLLQFHGDETDDTCKAAGLPFIKVIRVSDDVDVERTLRLYPHAAALMLDAAVPGIQGGTGRAFDWSKWPREADKPLILAGGLTPDNVAEAIARMRPYAVDVSSGVEGTTKGEKDPNKIAAFMQEVRRAR
ncbi:MAG TPA: phosphoribosylanthranilate isomerase [Pseudomonadales bacterium]|nr:phosphoribosylanthranilate isomerase [Pseudomonadales bacterium]